MSRRLGNATDLSAAILVSQSNLGAGFTRVPDCITTHPDLGPDEIFIALESLRLSADHGGDEAQLSYRYLKTRMRCGQARVQQARERLCATLPGVFTSVPGDSASMTPDTLTINRDGLLLAHGRWLAERELQRATRGNRTPRAVNVTLSTGNTVQVTAPVPGEVQGVSDQVHPCTQLDTALYPAGYNKKTYKTLKDTSSSQLASLVGEAEGQTMAVSRPEVEDGSKVKGKDEVLTKTAARPRGLTDADLQRFVAAWNSGKHERFASKRVAAPDERRGIEALVKAHAGNVAEALETWTLAISEVARLGAQADAMFWGDRARRPTMANLLPHWGKHSDSARARAEKPAAPREVAPYRPPAVI